MTTIFLLYNYGIDKVQLLESILIFLIVVAFYKSQYQIYPIHEAILFS